MNLSVNRESGQENYFRMAVEGEIDVFTAPQLKAELLPLTEVRGGTLILDLNDTEYIDSTALGVIVAALKSASRNQCHFSVTGMSPRIARLFTITGLTELLQRTETGGREENGQGK